MIRLEALLEELLSDVSALAPETLELGGASISSLRGRRLAAPLLATLDLPRTDVSAMDGWAVRSADLATAAAAAPVSLRVIGDAAAGGAASSTLLAPGTCVRIATGAPIPSGADAVVVVEATYLDDPRRGGEPLERSPAELPSVAWFASTVAPGAAIRRRGEDVVSGATLLPSGALLDPAAIAVVAASGARTISLARRPRVAILSSGDEIGDGADADVAIPDSNGPMLEALLSDAGAEIVARVSIGDSASAARAAVATTAASCDVLISSGGVSVGAHDHIATALAAHFEVLVRTVAMQPGKPLLVGRGRGAGRAIWAVGLPGNPVSAFVTATLVAVPLVAALSGSSRGLHAGREQGRLTAPLASPAGRRSFPRLRAERGADGAVRRGVDGAVLVTPLREQGSHQASALAQSDYLGDIPEECERLDAGDLVSLIALPRATRLLATTER